MQPFGGVGPTKPSAPPAKNVMGASLFYIIFYYINHLLSSCLEGGRSLTTNIKPRLLNDTCSTQFIKIPTLKRREDAVAHM